MQTIKYQGEIYKVINAISAPTEGFEMVRLFCARVTELSPFIYEFVEVDFYRDKRVKENNIEYSSFMKTKGDIENMNSFISCGDFQIEWDEFKGIIETEIIDSVKSARPIKSYELFHDVMLETKAHEISLDCVYQSYLLTNELQAESFRKQMLSNIEELIEEVQSNYSMYGEMMYG